MYSFGFGVFTGFESIWDALFSMLTSELSPSAWIFFPLSLPSSLRPLVPPRVCPVLFRSVAYLETWQAEQRRQLLCGVDGGKDKESSTAHI